MSDYQARSDASDMTDPANRTSAPDYRCEECGDNDFSKPYDLCWQHDMDYLRDDRNRLRDRVITFQNLLAVRDGQIDALALLLTKKDGQVEELMKGVELLSEYIDKKVKP